MPENQTLALCCYHWTIVFSNGNFCVDCVASFDVGSELLRIGADFICVFVNLNRLFGLLFQSSECFGDFCFDFEALALNQCIHIEFQIIWNIESHCFLASYFKHFCDWNECLHIQLFWFLCLFIAKCKSTNISELNLIRRLYWHAKERRLKSRSSWRLSFVPFNGIPCVYLARTTAFTFWSTRVKCSAQSIAASNFGSTYLSTSMVAVLVWKQYVSSLFVNDSSSIIHNLTCSRPIATVIFHSPKIGRSDSWNSSENTPLSVLTPFHCLIRFWQGSCWIDEYY